jgi:mannose-6-phosphate isomerase-like protein (cupin superfamily)
MTTAPQRLRGFDGRCVPFCPDWEEDTLVKPQRQKETKTMTGYVGAIEKQTLENTYFRQVLFTAKHSQLVVMCLRPGEEIGDEVHRNVDQFFRIEQGEAKFVFNEKEEHAVHDGDAVVVPAGTYHNVVNTSKTATLKLYTIYSPPNHPDGTVHKTKAEAEAAELVEHH